MNISIVSVCYSRHKELEQVLPSWLAQEGIEFDITLVVGPDVPRVDNPKITYIDWPDKKFNGCCKAFNVAWKSAKGPLIYSCYADMVLQDKHYIAKHFLHYAPNRIVNRQMWRPDGSLDQGLWMFGVLTSKELIEKSGGWDESMDGGYAWEDTDFMHSMIAAGGDLVILKPAEPELALKHIDHPRLENSPEWTERYVRNKRIYNRKRRTTIMDMYRGGQFKVYENTDIYRP